jgi:hypothetical protein
MAQPLEVQAEPGEQEEAPTLGFFIRGAGAIRFSGAPVPEVPGSSQTVVVAKRFGVVVFSDLQGGLGARWGCRFAPAAERLRRARPRGCRTWLAAAAESARARTVSPGWRRRRRRPTGLACPCCRRVCCDHQAAARAGQQRRPGKVSRPRRLAE